MRLTLSFFLLLICLSPAVAQTSLGYLDLRGAACCIAVDISGDTYVAAGPGPADPTVPESPTEGIVVAKYDRDLREVFRFAFGGLGYCAIRAITVDLQGNVLVAGQTSSPGFPLVRPLSAILTKVAPASSLR